MVKSKRYKFRERLNVSSVGRVDRDNNTIYDVRVCGVRSANGRKYSPTALKNAIPLYEGARVFFDHPEGEDNSRRFRERFGRLVNVREAEDGGLIADLKYNPMHPLTAQFLWLAENDPDEMGLSHNAEGLGTIDGDGNVLVEKITVVHSVDLVDRPATTFSLFEQDTTSMNEDEELTLNAADPAVTEPVDPEGEVGESMGIDHMLAELVEEIAKHPEWSKADKIAKIKDVINMMDDGVADEELLEAEEGDKEEGKEEEEDEEKMMEQLRKFKSKPVRTAAQHLLKESRRKLAVSKGLKADAITLVFLEQLVSVDTKKALKLIEDRKAIAGKGAAQSPRSFAPTNKSVTVAELASSIDWND